MHDLLKEQSFEHIPKEELMADLAENLELLKKNFDQLAQ